MTDKTAVLITGPRWWGDLSVDRAREPISISDSTVLAGRHIEVDEERRATEEAIAALPAGTLVIHGAARGADTLASQAAQRRGLPLASVPYFGHLGRSGGHERNAAMIAMTNGLKAAGWGVKVLAFAPTAEKQVTGDRTVTCSLNGTLSCVRMAREAELYVKVINPEPEPEPEPEQEASEDAEAAAE